MEVKFTAGETVRGLDLSGTGFENTDLSGASFGCCEECEKEGKYGVKMQKTLLDSVDMAGSQLNHCSLEGSVITDVRAVNSKLYDIDCDGSDLSGVNLVGSRLRCINLFGAEIENSCLANVRLSGCDIGGMTVDGVNVKEAVEAYKKAKN